MNLQIDQLWLSSLRNRKKKKLKNEQSFKDLWDTNKYTNKYIIWIPERDKGTELVQEIIFEEMT